MQLSENGYWHCYRQTANGTARPRLGHHPLTHAGLGETTKIDHIQAEIGYFKNTWWLA